MGHVREPIPQGLAPALRRACDERVLRAGLVEGPLELEFAVGLPSLAARAPRPPWPSCATRARGR
ncbi:hypothetical protein PPSIR1_24594 [Plesiocystis pacifica SIR-1]|uniref:Uncharacterized protein n=1 Tax=Plesiocystis pacifica SIR-1 TaxID=391625 RepID=A6GB66_9BACT|nr:hypothetical protein [Plesiocystis pacifica]EDM76863.1 hypothetical protein PPSIR1_24594 [Plesiocystis pacifica SIR-1]